MPMPVLPATAINDAGTVAPTEPTTGTEVTAIESTASDGDSHHTH